ncbi:sugar transporter [Pyrenophora seminiperda CCB06]|uniref:Sugar transporter n=1 Tax=Pyrenophora seminiperda CCB06 TaxID=1302712 RepID=A0A3M7M2Y2_9PLEO|nr:sugar transporter [Pyrenophora seminiperda CCB06]
MTIRSDCDDGMIMLGTYCTNFLICNLYVIHHRSGPDCANICSLIHVYFVVNQLLDALQPGPAYPMSCPQCQNGSFSVGNFKVGARLQGYAPLLDRTDEPRNSVHEPTAHEGDTLV